MVSDNEIVSSLLGRSTNFESALNNLLDEIKRSDGEFNIVVTKDLGTIVQINIEFQSILEPWGYVDKDTGNLYPAGDSIEESLSFPAVTNIFDYLNFKDGAQKA